MSYVNEDELVEIVKSLSQEPIFYKPIYQVLMQHLPSSILLSHIMSLFQDGVKFSVTDKILMSDIALSKAEIRSAKEKLKKLSFLNITREGIPSQTYYEIDWDNYYDVMNELVNGDL